MSKKAIAKSSALVSADKLLTEEVKISAAIASTNKRMGKIELEYQLIACSVMQHVAKHGDIRIVRHLFANLPASLHTNSMKEFFARYAPVTYDDKGEVHFDKAGKLQLGLALENAWWKAKKEAPYQPYVFEDKLRELYEGAVRRANKGVNPEKGDSINLELLNKIGELIRPVTVTTAAPVALAA